MKMKCRKKLSSCILYIMLIVAMAVFTTGCNGKTGSEAPLATETEKEAFSDGGILGEGSRQFSFIVVDKEGDETQFEIHTDQETVGEALLELGLIGGEDSEFGLFVKTVNGITADYDQDGVYWAFYVNDEYASSGVDSTVITEGEVYSFRVE